MSVEGPYISFGSGESGGEWHAGELGSLLHCFEVLKSTFCVNLGFLARLDEVLFLLVSFIVPYTSSNLASVSRMPWKKRFNVTSAGSWKSVSGDC